MVEIFEMMVRFVMILLVWILIVLWWCLEQVLLGLYFATHPHRDTDEFLSWW